MHCTLLVPDLLRPQGPDRTPYHDMHLPALARLLARARRTSLGARSTEMWLCEEFGVERQHDWPVAPLTIATDGRDAGAAYWLRCDPVHLRTQRGKLLLSDLGAFAPTTVEAQAIIASFNAHFARDNIEFHAQHPSRWYLRVNDPPEMTTQPLSEVVGQDIHHHLPSGADGARWHRTLNDLQMLLHDHPVNRERESADLPVINSVWLWGGGVKPDARLRPYDIAWSADALTSALAGAGNIATHPLPEHATSILESAGNGDRRHLVALTELRGAALSGNAEQSRATLSTLETNWFAPLRAALRQRRLTGVSLVVPGGDNCRRYDIQSADLWKFWRGLRAPRHHV